MIRYLQYLRYLKNSLDVMPDRPLAEVSHYVEKTAHVLRRLSAQHEVVCESARRRAQARHEPVRDPRRS